jgi:hypothetical protein
MGAKPSVFACGNRANKTTRRMSRRHLASRLVNRGGVAPWPAATWLPGLPARP